MAFSFVKYTGDGTTRVFNIPFSYLDRSHVSAKVGETAVSFSWLSNNTVQLALVPAAGAVIELRRKTPNATPLVDFTDGASITERDLDVLAYQTLYLNQESADLAEDLDASVEANATVLLTKVDQAIAASQAVLSTAQTALTKATTAENIVLSAGSQVNQDASLADLSKAAAQGFAGQAQTAAASATAAASQAGQHKTDAQAAASAAAASAAAAAVAANFNPSDFYTKVQADALLNTKVFQQSQISGLSTSLAGKANTTHTHTLADVTGLQTALDGKLDASGTATAANKLATPRTISLTGDVTGSASFDGSTNISIATTAGGVPAGTVIYTASGNVPGGYLKANGALVSRTTYADLFAAIGTTYGAGDGTTTFALPDLRGEFIRGWDDARGVDTGRTRGSFQNGAIESHTHTGTTSTDGAHTHTQAGQNSGGSSQNNTYQAGSSTTSGVAGSQLNTGSAGAHSHTLTINATGGTETRPRNVALMALIKF